MNKIALENISKNRSALMGVAIIWIFLYHSGYCGFPVYDFIIGYGWMGVDVFIFLSAFGVSFSLSKNSKIREFYKRRISRILPTWLFVLLCIHIAGTIVSILLPSLPFNYPKSANQIVQWYTGVGYWLNGIHESPYDYYYEWYIPVLIFLYFLSPFLFKKNIVFLICLFWISFIVSLVLTYSHILDSLQFAHHRLPVYICGIIFYKAVTQSNEVRIKIANVHFWLTVVVGILCVFCYFHTKFEFIQFFVPSLLVVPFLFVLGYLIQKIHIRLVLNFIGGISLELYLIHLYQRPNFFFYSIFPRHTFLNVAVTLLFCIIISYFIHLFFNSRLVKNIVNVVVSHLM